jgi:hypothetical protein
MVLCVLKCKVTLDKSLAEVVYENIIIRGGGEVMGFVVNFCFETKFDIVLIHLFDLLFIPIGISLE